jgi:hypothetical protein
MAIYLLFFKSHSTVEWSRKAQAKELQTIYNALSCRRMLCASAHLPHIQRKLTGDMNVSY